MLLRLRMAGLRGLHGVVKKTVSDDLQVSVTSCCKSIQTENSNLEG